MWWLVVSAMFFVLNIVFFGVMSYAVLKLTKVVGELQPQVSTLVKRVEEVAHRVDELTTTVKDSVEQIGGKAKGVIGSVELVAQSASRQFERFSPFVVGAMTAMKLIKGLKDMRGAQKGPKAKVIPKRK